MKIKSVFPAHLSWLVKTLSKGWGSRVLILEIIGDIAKLIRKRRQGPKESNTTCIACGGWIPKEREERRQHTCCDVCQNWYRILTRAIDAEKVCRYCGHGLPKPHKSVSKRRPAKTRLMSRKPKMDGSQGHGAPRHGYELKPMLPKIGAKIELVPDSAGGVQKDAVREALENEA